MGRTWKSHTHTHIWGDLCGRYAISFLPSLSPLSSSPHPCWLSGDTPPHPSRSAETCPASTQEYWDMLLHPLRSIEACPLIHPGVLRHPPHSPRSNETCPFIHPWVLRNAPCIPESEKHSCWLTSTEPIITNLGIIVYVMTGTEFWEHILSHLMDVSSLSANQWKEFHWIKDSHLESQVSWTELCVGHWLDQCPQGLESPAWCGQEKFDSLETTLLTQTLQLFKVSEIFNTIIMETTLLTTNQETWLVRPHTCSEYSRSLLAIHKPHSFPPSI